MRDIMNDEEIEALAKKRGENGHNGAHQNGEDSGGEYPSGEVKETVYEFSLTPKSANDAVGKGLRAAEAGTKTAMATRRAYERRKEIERQARRQKTKDTLQILGILTSFFA